MTRVKTKILLTCLCSVALLLCALLVVVNVAIPKDLERQAKRAIEHEYTAYDPEDDGARVNFLSSSVAYLEIGQTNEDIAYLTETERAVLAFCRNKQIVNGEFARIRDKNRNIVLAVYSSGEDFSEKYDYALYVDINAILNYVGWLNWMFCGAIVVVGAVICAIGLRLGKTIEAAQEIKQSFFQNASHELKTPLMAIQGYAEGIQTGVLPVKESTDIILEESDRMTLLIEEMLALSKIDSAQTKPDFAEQDAIQIVQSVLSSFAPVFENGGKELKCELGDEAIVLCDERQLRKAISNLVANAFRYCKTAVFVECSEKNGNLVIKVCDDGDGISKEDEAHIFDRFYTGKKGNSGIGLALTKEIVKMHGGKITSYNANGAVFEIVLQKNKTNKTKGDIEAVRRFSDVRGGATREVRDVIKCDCENGFIDF